MSEADLLPLRLVYDEWAKGNFSAGGATGERSGIETIKTFYAAWTFREGRVAHVRWEDDRETALKAVGLAE